mmetsp:Transcript_8624/g.22303  ORF Transcript_8624/g.22303 Transcript_8624/m.22303 type:complete len:362 (-) Transcript_8624:200-1285(-)
MCLQDMDCRATRTMGPRPRARRPRSCTLCFGEGPHCGHGPRHCRSSSGRRQSTHQVSGRYHADDPDGLGGAGHKIAAGRSSDVFLQSQRWEGSEKPENGRWFSATGFDGGSTPSFRRQCGTKCFKDMGCAAHTRLGSDRGHWRRGRRAFRGWGGWTPQHQHRYRHHRRHRRPRPAACAVPGWSPPNRAVGLGCSSARLVSRRQGTVLFQNRRRRKEQRHGRGNSTYDNTVGGRALLRRRHSAVHFEGVGDRAGSVLVFGDARSCRRGRRGSTFQTPGESLPQRADGSGHRVVDVAEGPGFHNVPGRRDTGDPEGLDRVDGHALVGAARTTRARRGGWWFCCWRSRKPRWTAKHKCPGRKRS